MPINDHVGRDQRRLDFQKTALVKELPGSAEQLGPQAKVFQYCRRAKVETGTIHWRFRSGPHSYLPPDCSPLNSGDPPSRQIAAVHIRHTDAADILVAVDALHRQLDVGQGGAVEVLLAGCLR